MVGDAPSTATSRYEDARDRVSRPSRSTEELEGTRDALLVGHDRAARRACKYKIDAQAQSATMPAEMGMMTAVWGMDERRVYLSPAPLYHSAPLFYCMSTMRLGGTVDRAWSSSIPRTRCACIEKYRVTHSQWVPTMFVRMLKLPDDVRTQVRPVVAPGRDPRRRAVPGRGEAQDDRVVGPDHRRVLRRDRRHGRDVHQQRPSGSRTPARSAARCSAPIHIVDEDGNELPAGEVGTVWFEPPPSRPGFEYHKDDAEDARLVQRPRAGRPSATWATSTTTATSILTDRRTFMIVSGGVNIYPQEAENVLITHPKVFDVAVFGIPDAEMGEKVHAVVQPIDVGRRRARARTRAARVLPRAPRALQVPEGDRLRPRAAAPADRQALQAPAPRPLLGQQDVAHRLMPTRPVRLIASGRDGDIFEFGPGLVLRTHARRPVDRGRSAHDGVRRASTAIPVPTDRTKCARAAPRS